MKSGKPRNHFLAMKRIFKNKAVYLNSFILCSSIVTSSVGLSQTQDNKKIEVLFLGNSYTAVNNLPQVIASIAQANGDTLTHDSNCPGGYTFEGHANNPTSTSKINAYPWDYVVLQAQSQEPSFPPAQVAQSTLPYALELNEQIHLNDSCTKTIFFETWGRKNGDPSNCQFYPPLCTYNGMQDRLRQSYKLFADECEAIMAPAGEAWRASIVSNPQLELYQSDESHPSMAGTYLTACVLYEVLFEKSTIGNTYTAGLPVNTSSFLQQIAHAVVNDSLEVWNIGNYNPCLVISSTHELHEIEIKTYPNPATDFIYFKLPNRFIAGEDSYRILNFAGQVQQQGELNASPISVVDLTLGLYFIEIKTTSHTYFTRFFKQ